MPIAQDAMPMPPLQTDDHVEAMRRGAAAAQVASEAATPRLLSFLGSDSVRAGLARCCPAAAQLEPPALLERLRTIVRTSELVHDFPVGGGAPGTTGSPDVSADMLMRHGWFLNLWQAKLLTAPPNASLVAERATLTATDFGLDDPAQDNAPPRRLVDAEVDARQARMRATLSEPGERTTPAFQRWLVLSTQARRFVDAEVTVFGLRPFANESRPTWREASSRLVYTAHNMRQMDSGSATVFGDVGAVFRTSRVAPFLLLTPVGAGRVAAAWPPRVPAEWPPRGRRVTAM